MIEVIEMMTMVEKREKMSKMAKKMTSKEKKMLEKLFIDVYNVGFDAGRTSLGNTKHELRKIFRKKK